jgi:hypothetical protein
MDRSSDLLELVRVLAGVVCAKEQLSAGGQLYTYVRLGTTAITAINGCERCARCDCGVHVWPLFSSSQWVNVT